MRIAATLAFVSLSVLAGGCAPQQPAPSSGPPTEARTVLGDVDTWTHRPGGGVLVASQWFVLFFGRGDAALSERNRLIARGAAERLLLVRRAAAGQVPNTRSLLRDPVLVLHGGADDAGPGETDQNLSERRVRAAAEELARAGVAGDLVVLGPKGRSGGLVPASPLDPQNRVVRIVFLDRAAPHAP